MVSARVVMGVAAAFVSSTHASSDDGHEFSMFRDANGRNCWYHHNADYTDDGHNVGYWPNTKNFRDCDAICVKAVGCRTWSWSSYRGGSCWLKTKASELVERRGVVSLSCEIDKSQTDFDVNDVSSYRTPRGAECYYYKNTDFPGADVGNKPAKDYHDCDRICLDFKNCRTWSWSSGTCWLKSGSSRFEKKDGVVSLSCVMEKPTKKQAKKAHDDDHHRVAVKLRHAH